MKKRMIIAIGIIVLAGCIYGWINYRLCRMPFLEPASRIVTVILPPVNQVERVKHRWLDRALHIMLHRLDSLRKDSTGRRIYDSLLSMRPGLPDSLKAIYPFPIFSNNIK